MRKIILILFLCFLSVRLLYAQNEDFASDRPGLTDAPDLIDRHTWQIASGADISRYNHYGIYQLSQNTIKYGISKRFEARMDFGLQYDSEKKVSSVSGPSVGMKALLASQYHIVPKTAFIIEFYPPSFGAQQQASGLGMELCFSNNLKSGNSIYYNAGANWLDLTQHPTYNALLGFSLKASASFTVFAEFYLYKAPGLKLNYVSDIGLTFQVNKKLQLDFATGLDILHPDGNSYFDGGITYNFSFDVF